MAKLRFQKSQAYDKLTIILVAKNLESLFYPFIESMWSTIPLGCRYLVGDFGCQDKTRHWLDKMSKYLPIEIVKGEWKSNAGLHAIGRATYELTQQVNTPLILNLQANEVLTDTCPGKILEFVEKQGDDIPELAGARLYFKHFWGNFNWEGTISGNAYNSAHRISTPKHDYRKGSGDGCFPGPANGGNIHGAIVHRYSYTFENQLVAKTRNHQKLFGDVVAAKRQQNVRRLRERPNYKGTHPSFVQHLIDRGNYDIDYSFKKFSEAVNPMGD